MLKTKLQILDLGCGDNKIPNAIGLDNAPLPGVDIVHDLLEFPYPIESESMTKIYIRHVIEHFNIADINKIFNECNRILRNNGSIIITVPHVFSISAFTDPTHKSFFTFESGKFWDMNNPKSYYDELNCKWNLLETSCRINWFDWKRYRLRNINNWFSGIIELRINKGLLNKNNPSLADRIVKKGSYQFVEISWTYTK